MENFNLDHWTRDWLLNLGLKPETASWFSLAVDFIVILLVCLVVDIIAKRVILVFVKTYVKKSRNTYDDVFLEKKVFQGFAHLIPAAIFWYSLPLIFEDSGIAYSWLRRLVTIYMVIVVLTVTARFLKAIEYIGLHTKRLQGKPVSSYVQVFQILVYIVGGVFILSMIIGKSPLAILTAFGAATAIVLLIFKDSILGLVASIQISANDMVRLGDWVTLEKYGADGDVIEINLTTVKIRNFDKTITTVPTYAFISDSFRNWRGMQTIGVRRIKRSLNIDLSSVKFVDEELYQRFMRFERIAGYVAEKQKEIDRYNAESGINKSELINGRHMTNLGVFRRYATNYLMGHPKIDQKQTIMVRQLQPTETGIPLEIYAFSSDIAWINYESIQADIFDHLIAAAGKFDLKIFQYPAGSDLKYLNFQSSAEK